MIKKRTRRKPAKVAEPDMRPEYEFAGAVRGKHYKRYLEGANAGLSGAQVARKFKNST